MTNNKKSLLAAWLCAASVAFTGCDKDNGPEKTIYVPEETSTAAVNLSENGTANCYIVKPGSVVSFETSYKGNSKTEPTGEGSVAKLIWQDTKGLVKTIYFDPELQTAYAEIANSKGNALVAVCDAAGTILWSWHLWICDYDPEKTLFTTEANAAGTLDIHGPEHRSHRHEQRIVRQLRDALPVGPQGSVPWSLRVHYPE